jgi:hypothetical protein
MGFLVTSDGFGMDITLQWFKELNMPSVVNLLAKTRQNLHDRKNCDFSIPTEYSRS